MAKRATVELANSRLASVGSMPRVASHSCAFQSPCRSTFPNFNYPGVGPDELFEKIAAIATTAEASGFSSVSVMDHLHQIRPSARRRTGCSRARRCSPRIAAARPQLTMGLMVGSVTYRNPAFAAKTTTTLDVISGGRALHGIGAGWFEAEHVAYGYDFPPLGTASRCSRRSCRSCARCSPQDQATLRGQALPRRRRLQQPQAGARRHPDPDRRQRRAQDAADGRPVRRRLQPVRRRRADRHLLGVLERHCEDVGRDPAEITKTRARRGC